MSDIPINSLVVEIPQIDFDDLSCLSDEQRRETWSLNEYLDWLEPQIEELLENRKSKRNQRKIKKLTKILGYFLFKKWYAKTYQPLGKNMQLDFWKWWADWYEIDNSDFDYIWDKNFV